MENKKDSSEGPNGLTSPPHDIQSWTDAKMKANCCKRASDPIKQDEKKNAPRFAHKIYPRKDYNWNNGALQQTWEDPEHTNALGNNDPSDIVEIGEKVQKHGAIVKVKDLGITASLDEGEPDWKFKYEALTQGSAHPANEDQWKTRVDVQPIPESVEKWHYVNAIKPPQKF